MLTTAHGTFRRSRCSRIDTRCVCTPPWGGGYGPSRRTLMRSGLPLELSEHSLRVCGSIEFRIDLQRLLQRLARLALVAALRVGQSKVVLINSVLRRLVD